MVSRMVLFFGLPERFTNLSRPAALVMSAKTMGAPSTNPPAVIGREWESLTAGCAPPVATPMPVGDWAGLGAGGCCAAATCRDKELDKMMMMMERFAKSPRGRARFR